MKPTRFTFLIERADGEIGTITTVSENLLIFFSQLDNKIFFSDLFNDFISLSEDLKKVELEALIKIPAEAQFIVFPPSIEADVDFTNAFETKNETSGTVSKNLELILIRLMRLSSIHMWGSIVR